MARNLNRTDWRDGHDDLDDAWASARRTARANRTADRNADDAKPNLERSYFAAMGMGR